MAHISAQSSKDVPHHSEGVMAEPRTREQLITGLAAVVVSLAIHAVLIFVGYVLYKVYLHAPAGKAVGILFAVRVEPSPEYVEAYKLQDVPHAENMVEAGIDAPDALRFDTSGLDDPLKLPDVIPDESDMRPVTPTFGPGATDTLFARPEELRKGLTEGFGDDRGPGGILGGTGGIGSAGSSFGSGLAQDFKHKDLLLVWLVDSSPSLLGQIDTLKGQISPLFDRLSKLSPGRLQMTVVSYGVKAELLLENPVTNPAAVTAALDEIRKRNLKKFKERVLARYRNPEVKIAPLAENTMRALREASTIRNAEGRQVVIALLTDERGDDAKNWQQALRALQAKNIPLFVFGPTTRMLSKSGQELLVIKDDAFVDKQLNPQTSKPVNPHGYALVAGRGDWGSAEAGREPYCRNWGAALFGVALEQPMIAGPFELSALVKLTGGKYYFIDKGRVVGAAGAAKLPPDAESAVNGVTADRQRNSAQKFDLSVMHEYTPEYSAKVRNRFINSFGKRLRDIVEEFEKAAKPPDRFASTREIRQAGRIAGTCLNRVEQAIKQVQALKAGPEVPRRWLAYRDLFLAQLYVARYNLVEYLKVVEGNYGRKLSTVPDADGFVHWLKLQRVPVAAPAKDMPTNETAGILTLEPVRAVMSSRKELDEFLKNKGVLGENQKRPEVNFEREMLIVVSLGRVHSPDAEVEILYVTQCGDTLEVVVREVNPKVSSRDQDRPYFPCHAVVVPRSQSLPKFVSFAEWSKARIAEEASLLKGRKTSAKFRQDAKIVVELVTRKYRGTPWAEVAKGMRNLGTFTLKEVKTKPPAEAASGTPVLPGDF